MLKKFDKYVNSQWMFVRMLVGIIGNILNRKGKNIFGEDGISFGVCIDKIGWFL